jgi:hypothetical protein
VQSWSKRDTYTMRLSIVVGPLVINEIDIYGSPQGQAIVSLPLSIKLDPDLESLVHNAALSYYWGVDEESMMSLEEHYTAFKGPEASAWTPHGPGR